MNMESHSSFTSREHQRRHQKRRTVKTIREQQPRTVKRTVKKAVRTSKLSPDEGRDREEIKKKKHYKNKK